MDFTLNNGLSMIGGDDFTTLQEEIDILDRSVVHKTGNLVESINGVKTFTSAFNVNTAGSVILTSDDIQLNNVAGNAGVDVNGTGVLMGAPSTGSVSVVDTTTFETLAKFSDTETIVRAPNFGSTLDIQGALMRIDGCAGGGLNQLFFGAVNPFSSIEFRNASMTFLNTDVVVSTDTASPGGRQMGISATSTMTGDLIFLLNKRTGTGADFTASGYRMIRENATGDFVLQRRTASSGGLATTTAIQRISGLTSETFTMPTQTKVATTAFKVQNVAGTDRLLISPTNYLLQSAPLSPLSIFSGTYSVYQAGTTMAMTAGDTMSLSANTSITENVGVAVKSETTPTTTTITNTNIFFNMGDQFTVTSFNTRINATSTNFLKINNVDKMVTTSTETTITNANVNVSGQLNITDGGETIKMIGSGVGGLFTSYFPDGNAAGRKCYVGFPTTGSQNFNINNEYTGANPIIELGVKGASKAYFGNTDTYINNTTRVELQLNAVEKIAILNAETYIRNSDFIGAYVNGINRIDCYLSGNNYNFNPANTTVSQRWRITDNGSQTNFRVQQNTTGVQLNNGNTAWSALSDRRIKKGIEPIDKALDKINELNPVLFNYNEDPETRGKRFGFIAQEVQQVFPELVDDSGLCCNDFEGVVDECLDTYLCLETTSLIPYLVKAIQDLNKKVEEQALIINQLVSKSQ